MKAAVSIRQATRADRATVMRFHRELYVRYRDEITRPEVLPLFAYKDLDGTLSDDVDGLLRTQDATVLLAERDTTPVGYVTGHVESDPRRVLPRKGVIEDWYVLPAERGQGTGKLLLESLIERFRGAGCHVVESGTWAFNEGARKAHLALGFNEIEVKFRKRL
ncbi:MAG: GNAT family N-acetyltransferase [Myxococcales bacterium]